MIRNQILICNHKPQLAYKMRLIRLAPYSSIGGPTPSVNFNHYTDPAPTKSPNIPRESRTVTRYRGSGTCTLDKFSPECRSLPVRSEPSAHHWSTSRDTKPAKRHQIQLLAPPAGHAMAARSTSESECRSLNERTFSARPAVPSYGIMVARR